MKSQHHDLPEDLLLRIQNIWFATRDVFSVTLEKTIENFQRDLRPESEVRVWEQIISTMFVAMDHLDTQDQETKQQVFNIVLQLSLGNHESVIADTKSGEIDESIMAAVASACMDVVPDVVVSDVEDDGSDLLASNERPTNR